MGKKKQKEKKETEAKGAEPRKGAARVLAAGDWDQRPLLVLLGDPRQLPQVSRGT